MSDHISRHPGILEAAIALERWLDNVYPESVFGCERSFWDSEADVGVNAVGFIRYAVGKIIATGGEANPDYEAVFVNKKYFEALEAIADD